MGRLSDAKRDLKFLKSILEIEQKELKNLKNGISNLHILNLHIADSFLR